ncbi:MAG: class F sortase [Candidatus Dormibacteria bacterium]
MTQERVPGMRRALLLCVAGLLGATVLAGSAAPATRRVAAHPLPTQVEAANPLPAGDAGAPLPTVQVPAPLVDPQMDLRAPPVEVPLRVIIPGLKVDVPVLGTGLSGPDNVVDAPRGGLDDPIWQKAFWYRGSGVPGDSGTAAIAGHVDDLRGRPSPFYQLRNMKAGDQIVIRDTRVNLEMHFTVTEVQEYTAQQASTPGILSRIYGAGPAAGRGAQPSPDGVSHLTLLTCHGDFVNGSFDHRLVVFADRSS